MKHLCFPFLLLIFSIGCIKPVKRNNQITKIELTRTGAWATRAATTIIDSSLVYKYWNCGEQGTKHGYLIGKVSEGFWDTLNMKFEKLNLKTIKPDIYIPYRDGSFYDLIVYWGNHKRNLIRGVKGYPNSSGPLIDMLNWIDESNKRIKLNNASKPFDFESSYHPQPMQMGSVSKN